MNTKTGQKLTQKISMNRGMVGAVLAAVAASVCCVGPLLLLGLGIGGAWVGNLTALEPFRPYLMGLTAVLLGYAFYRIYSKPKAEACEPGSYCANPKSDKINKISLWIVTVFVVGLLAFPYLTPVLFAG
ncbi:MAG: mercuric transporter MerT family protein, partial [Candidatus Neomarinimicrobiota bacterium]